MKVIDILNKIANGEELPKEIIQHSKIFEDIYWKLEKNVYFNSDDYDFIAVQSTCSLNDEIEIVEVLNDNNSSGN